MMREHQEQNLPDSPHCRVTLLARRPFGRSHGCGVGDDGLRRHSSSSRSSSSISSSAARRAANRRRFLQQR
ncbi:hypothetical protein Y032_0312g2175 [Ancylostoma ceylanicum]|uniref:Uncharacterized protein n=1 Tax=Ancylostoma ceylanicum TaxID=53326 RepID=A0A016S2F4_9BILA|nr:hypothetical protein Y032_0312g2175 [Ancylostoma ceylanicum]